MDLRINCCFRVDRGRLVGPGDGFEVGLGFLEGPEDDFEEDPGCLRERLAC